MNDQAGRSRGSDPSSGRGGQIAETPRNSGDAISSALAERVLSGELAAGDQLPSERRLALEFGASRPMVREALRSLIERGLIKVEPGRGAFVLSETATRRFQRLDLEYRRRGTTARQLSEARLMLETEAVALATEHADADDLAALGGALERLEASPTPLDRVRNDLAFHAALVAASHNPVIQTMFASIQGLTVELMVRSAGDAEIVRQSAPYHRIAYEAIRDRNAVAARAAMQAHLSIAASTYGDDYDRSLDTTASRALRLIGSGAGLEEFLRAVLRDESGS
ncbi:MAG TPA: FCD domain-containing protein [Candidatus Eisenbacteria bacterium]|nr:FCD domain-containing protein [Candidatus Eisenbacteria bacterium]